MSAEFLAALASVQDRMETELEQALPLPAGAQRVVSEAIRYAALGGGKRLRPFLLIETARLFGDVGLLAWRTAAALECIHVYSLVHDDLPCMDDDDLRRGKPTVHIAFDEAMAVLAGDALQTRAFAWIAQAEGDPDLKIKLIDELARASGVNGMVGGQVIDITVDEATRDEALISQLQKLKTGALIVYAVRAGGLIGGADEETLDRLEAYAQDVGLAFQIKDDILDVEGDVEAVGKAVGKDENLGKVTFVSIFGLEGARSKARALGERAKSHLEPFGNRAKILCDTVDFVLSRDR